MNLRKFSVLVFALSMLTSPMAKADLVIDPSIPKLGLWLVENGGLTSMPSVIYGSAKSQLGSSQDLKLCGEITSQICTDAALIQVNNFLPICKTTTDFNCIAKVWASDSSGKKIYGTAGRRYPAKTNGDYSAVPAMGLPEGNGQGSIFNIPGVKHAGGNDNYLILVHDFYTIQKRPGQPATELKYEVNNMHAGIIPVNEYSGNYQAGTVRDGFAGSGSGGNAPTGEECQVTDVGSCLVSQNFPTDYQFGISIRTSSHVIGWFHGRIHAPTINLTSTGTGEEISIQAEPVRVTSIDYLAPTSAYSQEAKDVVFSGRGWGILGGPQGIKINQNLDSEDARTLFKLFNPVYKDTSSGEKTFWGVESMVNGQNQNQVTRCANQSGGLGGIVTTNSLLYSSGPPTFNKSTMSLDYQLASPHFESNGNVTSGSYDLLIRSDVARCIYGFSKAPITASISVISSDGSPKVATSVLGEKDGWLYLSAQGFEFSSPTVRVKLSQGSAAVSQITCLKGKTKKVISGAKPTCPSGYKILK